MSTKLSVGDAVGHILYKSTADLQNMAEFAGQMLHHQPDALMEECGRDLAKKTSQNSQSPYSALTERPKPLLYAV